MIYLLHFDRPLHHARHYLGYAADIDKRVARHWAGHGSRLVRAVMQAGIGVKVVCRWDGDRHLERKLHNRKNSSRLCPICREARRQKT
jgi:hypothetical protein